MFARFDEIPSMAIRYQGNCLYKSHKELQRERTHIVSAPSSKFFISNICLVHMNVFAKFDEIHQRLSKILRKENGTDTLSFVRPFVRTDGQRENSITCHKHNLGGYNYDKNNL